MPCNSDYMEANELELEISRVLCLLEEIKTGKPINPNSKEWTGYHSKVYNKGLERDDADKLVAALCDNLKKVDIKKYSLEMQLWWREHQNADRKREAQERAKREEAKNFRAALKKLSAKEVQLLVKHGLKKP